MEYLESVSTYQSSELMKMQREVYHLQLLLSSHGIDSALVYSSSKHAALLSLLSHYNVIQITLRRCEC